MGLAPPHSLTSPLWLDGTAHDCGNSRGCGLPPSSVQADFRFCQSASIDRAESASLLSTVLHRVNSGNDIRRRHRNVYSAAVFVAATLPEFPPISRAQSCASPP